jgi:serine/threonine protein kinase
MFRDGITRALLLLAALCIAGCRAELELTRWTLETDDGSRPITLPAHLDLGRRRQLYRLRTTATLPPELAGSRVQLTIPLLQAQASLRAAGQALPRLRGGFGDGYRVPEPQVWELPPELTAAGSVELELDVDHRWTQSAHLDTPPFLSAPAPPIERALRSVSLHGGAVALVALAQIGLLYLAIFVVDRRRRAYLWFALQALAASYYPFFVLGLSQRLLGTYDTNFLGFLITVAPITSVYFTHAHFDLPPPSRLWLLPVALSFAGALVLDPFLTTQVIGKLAVGAVALTVVYQLILCRRLARQRRPGANILFLSWLFLAATAWADCISWVGLGEMVGGMRPACIGLALFSLMQSILLGRDHIRSLHDADRLNVALDARVHALEERQAEIEQLNRELQRQIGERSRQLFAAMSLAGGAIGTPPKLEEGQLVQGRYRVVCPIAAGGMGSVYRVTRVDDDARLAIKVPHRLSGRELARLAREAHACAQVRHENLVGVLDVDVSADGFLFIVFEYVDGTPLNAFEERYGDVAWALPILRQVAGGMAALHTAGVVHRDLKPANILIEERNGRPHVKIADFGVSRVRAQEPPRLQREDDGGGKIHAVREMLVDLLRRDGSTDRTARYGVPNEEITQRHDQTSSETSHTTPQSSGSFDEWITAPGQLSGTPPYVPPEAATTDSIAPTADVFAFGVVAYRVLGGRYPFTEPPLLAALAERELLPATALADRNPDVPTHIADLVDRCLALQPEARPMADEIHALLGRASSATGVTTAGE